MSIGQLLSQGGWAMFPIYLCSFVGMFFFFERLFLYWTIRSRELLWLAPIIKKVKQREFHRAIEYCHGIKHPITDALEASIQTLLVRPDRAKAEAERVGQNTLDRYERFVRLQSFIAQVAPLLGLLGTVIGMVKMFYGLQKAGLGNVDAAALSSGIWQALLTTAAGLIVAAPALAAYMYLSAQVDRLRSQMRDAVEQLITAFPPLSSCSSPELSKSPESPESLGNRDV